MELAALREAEDGPSRRLLRDSNTPEIGGKAEVADAAQNVAD
jgi:hypothetical protein